MRAIAISAALLARLESLSHIMAPVFDSLSFGQLWRRRSCKVCQITSKVVFDGRHPERASWDGYLPDEDSVGCKDADNMPRIGEPQDECAQLCADTPPCKYFWTEHAGGRSGYCCLKSQFDPGMGTRDTGMPNGRFYELEG